MGVLLLFSKYYMLFNHL